MCCCYYFGASWHSYSRDELSLCASGLQTNLPYLFVLNQPVFNRSGHLGRFCFTANWFDYCIGFKCGAIYEEKREKRGMTPLIQKKRDAGDPASRRFFNYQVLQPEVDTYEEATTQDVIQRWVCICLYVWRVQARLLIWHVVDPCAYREAVWKLVASGQIPVHCWLGSRIGYWRTASDSLRIFHAVNIATYNL